MTITYIDALVTGLRKLYRPPSSAYPNCNSGIMNKAADALEAQQAVVEAAREVWAQAPYVGHNTFGKLAQALAALDAPAGRGWVMRRRGKSPAHFKVGDKGPADALNRAMESKQCVNCEALRADLKAVADALGYLMDFVETDLKTVSQEEWAAQREWVMSEGCDALNREGVKK